MRDRKNKSYCYICSHVHRHACGRTRSLPSKPASSERRSRRCLIFVQRRQSVTATCTQTSGQRSCNCSRQALRSAGMLHVAYHICCILHDGRCQRHTSCMLHAACCGLHVARCCMLCVMLRIARDMSHASCCVLRVARCMLKGATCIMLALAQCSVSCCVWCAAGFSMLHATRCMLLVDC